MKRESSARARAPGPVGFGRYVRAGAAVYVSPEFAYFLIFGGLAALTNLAIGAVLYAPPALMPYWIAVFTGASTGLVVNFALNYRFNFRFRGRSMIAQFRTFCLVSGTGVVLTTLLSLMLRGVFTRLGAATILARYSIPVTTDFFSHFCSVGLVTFYSFAAHNFLTFNLGIRHRLRGFLRTLSDR
jgi:putative flippase GtrA